MLFKLNPYITTSYRLAALKRNDSGKRETVYYVFKPNKLYDTSIFVQDTPNIEHLIESKVQHIGYSRQAKETLDKMNAPYSLQGCQSCGGKTTAIKVKVFVEVE